MQGHSVEELPFRAMGGVYGSWFGVILLTLVLIAQFYVVCFAHLGPFSAEFNIYSGAVASRGDVQ